jgi:stress response protein SCP2
MRRGFRAKLADALVDPNQPFSVEIAMSGNAEYDFSCFGLDGDEKLSDERYFVFYNNERSPQNEISLSQNGGSAVFSVNLAALPAYIQRLHFTINIDGNGVMREMSSCRVSLKQNSVIAFRLSMTGGDFQNEKAIIVVEIYKKELWRIFAVANGFNGGLSGLLRHYGGEEADADREPLAETAPYRTEQAGAPPPPPAHPSPPAPLKSRIRDIDGAEFPVSNDDWV